MAQSFTTPQGTLYVPSATVSTVVQAPAGGLATTGVLMLVGEADAGPDVASDSVLIGDNSFGPDALASVISKYRSGPLVDAFRLAIAAANDPNIQGSFASAYLVKTNVSAKASGTLARPGFTDWSVIADKSFGEFGNLISVQVSQNVAEVAPTTGQFTFIPSYQSSALSLRVNGQAVQALTIAAKELPSSLVGTVSSTAGQAFNSLTIGGLNNIHATGGVNRGVIGAGLIAAANLAAASNGSVLTITLSTGSWSVTPSVGDTLIIPLTGEYGAAGNSVIAGAGSAPSGQLNAGNYVVTAASSNSITATKLRENSARGLATVAVSAVAIAAITDLMCFSPVQVWNMSGAERLALTGLVGKTITGTAAGQNLTLTLQSGSVWAALPQAGDIVVMPSTAPAAFLAGGVNGGWYQVTSATSGTTTNATKIVMTRLSNGAPTSFSATAIAAVTDLRVLTPVIDGVGKTLEIFDGGGTEAIDSPGMFYNLNTSLVSWISNPGLNSILTSASEFSALITAARSSDGLSESFAGSGDPILSLGFNGQGVSSTITGTATVSGTTLTTSVSGGNGSNLTVDLTKFKTVSDLAAFLNSQTGYVSAPASTLYGQLPLIYLDATGAKQTILDKTTWNIASHLITSALGGSAAGRMKREAYYMFNKLSQDSILVQLGVTPAAPLAGQPDVQQLVFLSGGTRGGTTDASFAAGLAQLEKVRGNFVVPLFSRDATADIADGLTNSASSYTIDGINAATKTHVLAMSTLKRRRNRQCYLSKETSFTLAKAAANNLASARCSLVFQDFKALDSNSSLVQYQPWVGAVIAASMQAAGFYKPIVKKFMNVSGVLMKDKSYSDQVLSDVESALQNGLLPAEKAETGGFRWVSDQTTYAIDNNFVWNSSQAVYVADTIVVTLAQRMEQVFVGQSLADISAGVMLAYLSAVMGDFKRLKLTASSDDAPLGFKNAQVKISGPAAQISLEVKLAGALYFIPITAYITQVTQSASL